MSVTVMDAMPTYDYVQLLVKRVDIDIEDDLENAWRSDYAVVEKALFYQGDKLRGDKEINSFLIGFVNEDASHLEVLVNGFLYGILSSPSHMAREFLKYMGWFVSDRFTFCIDQLTMFILQKYEFATDGCKKQVLWLVKELIIMDLARVKKCIIALMKNCVSGNIAPENILLIESLTDLCLQYKTWIYSTPKLLPYVLFNFLSLIEDHLIRDLDQLKEKETELCIMIIREQFEQVKELGRDLVRLLQGLTRIPDFKALWEDMMSDPKSIHPNFNGIWDLLVIAPNQHLFAQRLTPSMEKFLEFMFRNVIFGSQTRYQEWFRVRYLTQPPGCDIPCPVENLLPHVIRYIVCSFHPDNTLLQSKMLPRWALLGYLLKIKVSRHTNANMKLAFVYDWLFFAPGENIMNIEPAILLIHASLKREFFDVAGSIIEFLVLQSKYYDTTDTQFRVRQGIINSLTACVEKRVIPDLNAIFSNLQRFPDLLRNLILEECSPFTKFLQQKSKSPTNGNHNLAQPTPPMKRSRGNEQSVPFPETKKMKPSQTTETFKENPKHVVNEATRSKLGIKSTLAMFDENLEKLVETVTQGTSNGTTEMINAVLSSLLEQGKNKKRDASFLQAVKDLATLFVKILTNEIMSASTLSDLLEAEYLYCQIFKIYLEYPKSMAVCTLLKEMRDLSPSFGPRFLCYLFGTRHKDNLNNLMKMMSDDSIEQTMNIYIQFLGAMSGNSLENKISRDLNVLALTDIDTTLLVIPYFFKYMKNSAVGHFEIIELLCSSVYPSQLSNICYRIKMREFSVLGRADLLANGTLNWGSFQQYCFWKIVEAEIGQTESVTDVLSILDNINPNENEEAVDGAITVISSYPPTEDTLRKLFQLSSSFSQFTSTIICKWEYLMNSQLLSSLICRAIALVGDQGEAKKYLNHFRTILKLQTFRNGNEHWINSVQFRGAINKMMSTYNLSSDVFSVTPMELDEGFSASSFLIRKENKIEVGEETTTTQNKVHRTRQRTKKETNGATQIQLSDKENISALKEQSLNNVNIEQIPNGL